METFEVQAVLSAIDKNFTSVMKEVQKLTDATTKTADNASKNLGKMNDSAKRGLPSIGNVVKGLGLFKVADAGINAVKNSLGGAIERFDKLSQFPKVLEALGASTSDAADATNILKKGIDGLPTTLQDASSTAQQMFSVFKDGKKAANTTIALNNALLASGASGDAAARATDQYLKILRTGKVDLDSYGSLQENMSVGLDKLAAKFGFTGASAQNDLYKALQSGKVTIDDFNQGLYDIQGGLGGTAEIAKKSTEGIGTSMKNIGTAITTGLANSIKTINDTLKKQGFDNIFEMLNKVKGAISEGFNSFNAALPDILEKLGKAIKFVGDNADWIIPILSGVASSFVAFSAAEKSIKVITGIKEAFAEFKGISSLIGMIGPVGWIAIGIGAIVAAGVLLYKNWDTVKEFADKVWSGVKDVIGGAADWVTEKWEGTKSFFNGIWDNVTSTTKSAWDGVSSTVSDSAQKTKDDWASITSFFSGIWDSIKQTVDDVSSTIKSTFNAVVDDVKAKWETVTNFFKGIWDSVTEGVTNFISIVTEKFNFVKSLFSPLITALSNIKGYFMVAAHNAIVGMVDIFKSGFTILKNVVLAPVLFIASLISGGWDEAVNNMKAVWENIVTAFKDIWINIQFIFISTITAIKNTLNAAWNGIFISAQKVWTQIQLFFTNLWISITTSIKTAWIDVKLFFTNLWIDIIYGVQTAWTNIQTFVTDTIANTIQGAKDLWNAFTTFLSDLWTGIKTTVSSSVTQTKTDTINTWDSLIQWGKDTWNGFTTFLSTTWDNIVNGAKQAWDNMTQGISDAIQTVKDTFDKLREIDLFEIGKNIIDGLVNGIKEKAQAVKDAVKDVASSITDKVQKILHIASPSKVMKKMGGFTAEGLAIGIADGANSVSKASDLLAQAAQPDLDMSASLANMNGSMSSTIQHEVNMGKAKQSATFNVNLGNQQFTAFVDDISQAMGNNAEINLAF
ncbi:hypothetical protein OMY_01386 [Enterococcus sulfureus ATCC 49903]|uniref:Tape measure protein N-terminal domain-containing protein n=1 Tax=Enterococcus sulfureus ATCC 49903 TaxID=1140003 RepID=S0L4A8_9ENTE|nr:tape measure protein [Enterococcus sulfureus]EOT47133.1 hypothetical protein OMY_01386 [Enterococcus sulfureus ATCC 49903]EOT83572.1 hypothetical protein I573_01294 [Enterococcus sulfureus ATCC 49903]